MKWSGAEESYLQELWCLPLCKYAARGSVYVRHCNTELRKQVFPRFSRPAPCKSYTPSSQLLLDNFSVNSMSYDQTTTT